MVHEPEQRSFQSQRLRLAYWDWGNEDAPPLVLVHGGRDHSRAWDRIAARLRDDYHVVALDMRGHGNSEWSSGGDYGMPEMAIDVVRLIEVVGSPARVVAHSYGAASCLVAAGSYPEHFLALAAIEGTHSLNPDLAEGMGPRWIREWGDRVRGYEESRPLVYPDLEAAAKRLHQGNPRLSPDLLAALTSYAAKPVEGGYIWKLDLWVNQRTSMEIRREEMPRFWAAIECPVLLIFARETRQNQQADAGRHFRSARTVLVDDAGHWVHHDQPEAVLAALRPFLADPVANVAQG